jgi:hypothetical protein
MTSRVLTYAAALAVAAPIVLAAGAPASAQRWHNWHGRGFGAGLAGLAAGAVIGAATAPLWGYGYGYGYYGGYGYPGYAYHTGYMPAPDYAYAPDDGYYSGPGYVYGAVGVPTVTYAAPGPGFDPGYCASRYRSYDPASGTYLGYDGMRHPCP